MRQISLRIYSLFYLIPFSLYLQFLSLVDENFDFFFSFSSNLF